MNPPAGAGSLVSMPRRLRIAPGGLVYHVLNRGNALRAGLVSSAPQWRWSSLWRREHEQASGLLSDWPVPEPADWIALVNRPQNPREEEALRRCVAKGRPYGSESFEQWTAELLCLKPAFRERGQPAKEGGEYDS